ncbi:MAG: cytochrome c oxidase subunit I [Bacillota bacterium]|nr:MAG: cytochrome c oxidase subunit I [Bacillota bacterium]
MAVLEQPRQVGLLRRPTSLTGFWSWVTTVDHKRIGILYFWTAFFFLLVGGIEALVMRLQLAHPDLELVTGDRFNELVTMHGTTMIFLAVMPLSSAFFNYMLPLLIGARDVAFPRLNALSYWLYLFGGILLNVSWLFGGAPNAGWFGYAPLTSSVYNLGRGIDFWIQGLQLLGVSSLISAINFIVTIFNMRAPGMSLMRMPVFVWNQLATSFLLLFSLPAVTVALIMLMFDRYFGANFFNAAKGGDAILWQHLFWVFGHPEVYIIILPAMGIVSEVLPTFSRKPLFGYSAVVFSTALIAFLAFGVWSHHMFTVGQGPVVNTVFALTTMTIAIPTGVKIFNWLATLWGGSIRFTTALLYSLGFLSMFTIGGLSGVMHSAAASNLQQHDTYFVVAHFHYVLIGGALFGLFAGIYYWFPKMFGRMLDERLGKWGFWVMLIGFNVTFFPFHFLGLLGMPRRIYTYPAELGLARWNLVSTIGAFILSVGILIFLVNVWKSLRYGEKAGPDPWDGRTLEWSIPSPPPVYNFRRIPYVHTRDPHWARKYPHLAQAEEPPPAATAADSEAEHGIHLPSPSYMPILLALAITVGAFGGVFRNVPLVALGVVGTIVSVYLWSVEGEGGIVVEPEGDA